MIKFFAGSMIVIASFLISFSISDRKRKEELFVKEYIDFLNFLTSELTFYKREMNDILSRYISENDSIFSRFLSENNSSVKSKYPDSQFVIESINNIKEMDVSSQSKYLDYCMNIANKMLNNREKSTKYNNSLTKKLVPLIGVVIFIIII